MMTRLICCALSIGAVLSLDHATIAQGQVAVQEGSKGTGRSPAFEFFRSENNAVATGNERMSANDAAGALTAYDEAAKALPNDAGVHLNRGLALMAQGQLDKAAPAFQLATQPPADKKLRSQAFYNLGNAFFRQGEALAKKETPEEAQKMFREAVDAYKQSLRLNPGQSHTAWNLQLASRRLRQEEEKQKQQEEQEQNEDDNQEGQEDQDKNEPGDGDPQQEDGQEKEQGQGDQDKKPEPKENSDGNEQPEPEQGQQEPEKLPSDARRALDALQDGEENLQKHQAQQRAGSQRRRPEKDW